MTLKTSAHVGMSFLDLSKTLMYHFHYKYIKRKYNNKAKLLFTDTDSLTYKISTEDIYKDFWADKNICDNSEYAENSPFFTKKKKKVTDKLKIKLTVFRY